MRSPPRFIRFLLVGASAVAMNTALFALLVGVARAPYVWATVIIFFVGNAYGFVANRGWTFSEKDRPGRRLALYYVTMFASLGANVLSMVALIEGLGMHYIIASAATSIWLGPVLYLTHRRVAFRPSRESRQANVMLVTNYYPEHGGGVEIVAGELSNRIRLRWPVHWYAAGAADAPNSTSVFRVPIESWNGIERRLGLPVPIPRLTGLARIIRGVAASRVVWVHDVVYIANFLAAVTALAYRRPLLITIHIGAIPYRRRVIRGLMFAILAAAGPAVLTRADAVTFVSDRVRKEFRDRWKLRFAQLIPNGVDASVFRPASDAERRTTRRMLGIESEPMVVFAGRFVERKGVHLLGDIARETPGIRWVFAGDGPVDPRRWSLPNVHVVGRCTREFVAQLFAAAELVVLPSVGEGFPLVVQEALAAGARVLVDPTTAEGFPGVGDYVVCEPVGDPRAVERWRSRVEGLVDAPDTHEKRDARVAFAREQWNWDTAAEAYRALITDCVRA